MDQNIFYILHYHHRFIIKDPLINKKDTKYQVFLRLVLKNMWVA